jgi:alpha-tubulin suppressor-like RCC1 family protein
MTCGVTTDGRLFCWSYNGNGWLGDGTLVVRRLRPAAVVGGRRYRQVSVGWSHACAVTTSSQAYCWGNNLAGRLGGGSTVESRSTPVLVAGGHSFRQVSAGVDHTCAVTTGNQAFCWGRGSVGQIGDGKAWYQRRTPKLVSGGLSFRRVGAGAFHTCGVTTSNLAYCWGLNSYGGLGDGTDIGRLIPVAVGGPRFFTQVSAGSKYSCGVASGNVGYCWGSNLYSNLGDGTSETRLSPVPVAGTM